ncbi:hypothetical protein EV359DRAFT_65278 [Lentinula novae-zelandiae]|nr:hypothetical protein EV359DRAFT_65278 [Lentinula novae-zelandiae]
MAMILDRTTDLGHERSISGKDRIAPESLKRRRLRRRLPIVMLQEDNGWKFEATSPLLLSSILFVTPHEYHKKSHRSLNHFSCARCYLAEQLDEESWQLILEAGHTTVDGNKIGVIVMKRMSGEPLQETDVWKSASREHKAKICQKVAQYMLQLTYHLVIQGFLHADFSPSNVLVKFTSMNGQDPELETVYIVDWGHPGIYTTNLTRLPDKNSYTVWFFQRWVFLWQSINNELYAGKEAASKDGASAKGHEGKNQKRRLPWS